MITNETLQLKNHSSLIVNPSLDDKPKIFVNETNEFHKLNLTSVVSNNQFKIRFRSKCASLKQDGSDENNNYLDANLTDSKIASIDDFNSLLVRNDHAKFKTKIYLSYLNYGSVNPFISNYDILHKNNPEFYKTLIKKPIEHSDSSYSLRSNAEKYKKILRLKETKKENILENEIELQATAKTNEELKLPDKNSVQSREDSTKNSIRILQQINTNKDKKKLSVVPNQFLIYRNEFVIPNKENSVKTNSSSQNNTNYIKLHSKDNSSLLSHNDKIFKENQNALVTNTNNKTNLLKEYRILNGQHTFLDASKLNYIVNWVEKVNKVQANEGKHTNTINKIFFYD
ncbi:unnamed protein product [Brachionus calyciflorus]|uniref:Uncharacterized protein n=1 Tax=Brachionus calyciflorus TaxID=104777 RepID=A0A814ESF3_9BILA|nr:unnamed protein product [Brachionus calyciflorus]